MAGLTISFVGAIMCPNNEIREFSLNFEGWPVANTIDSDEFTSAV